MAQLSPTKATGEERSDELLRLVEWSSGGLLPDIVVLITVSVEMADSRLGENRDRIESKTQTAQRVIEGFRTLANSDPARWLIIDGDGSIEKSLNESLRLLTPYDRQFRCMIGQETAVALRTTITAPLPAYLYWPKWLRATNSCYRPGS